MAQPPVEAEIDRLYQLPLADFTRERNAAARSAAGEAGKRIRSLAKPSVSAWGVNQVYWRDRKTYDALVAASERLRAAHRAALAGRRADLRAADAAHREALKAALASTLRVLSEAGHRPSSATETEVARTLESLPAGEPGRLTKALHPGGFEALAGMPVRGRAADARGGTPPAPAEKPSQRKDEEAKRRAREAAERARREARREEQRARAELSSAQKRLKAAEERSAAAKASWERAREEEIEARDALRRAQELLDRRVREVRRAEDELEG